MKKRGARVHPRSGAGRIKHDGSTAEELIEVKDAAKSFTLQRSYIAGLHRQAAMQGKEAVLLVNFPGYICEVVVRRSDSASGS